jgi:hypothetical protein
MPLKINQSKSSACALVFISIYQATDVYISYQRCEYQLIGTLNEWFIGGLVLAYQIQAHLRIRFFFSVYQSIDVHTCIIYKCPKYQLIWSYNEWFIGLLVLANQIQVHAHADGQFWPHRLIKCFDPYLRHKYQANPMKNNEVIVQWNVHRYNTFARACMCRPAILTMQISWGPQYLSTI